MNKKSIIRILFACVLTVLTVSCTDIFNIDSNRVVYKHNNKLDSSADSVYSIMGILHNFQKIADRYVILGEVRGDMVDVNENTKASLRNLAEFNFDDENEYLNVRDYYNVINCCNYVIENMDTTIRHNNEMVMTDEYVAALSIRAWTYMQLAINYGKIPYYTNSITTVAESEADYPMLDIKSLAKELIPQLMPYKDYKMPEFEGIKAAGADVTFELFPPIQLILGDLYLWYGDYYDAYETYHDFITMNRNIHFIAVTGSETTTFNGMVPLGSGQVTTTSKMTKREYSNRGFIPYTKGLAISNGNAGEALCVVPMEKSSQTGIVSEVPSLFYSTDQTHQLVGSAMWQELSDAQEYVLASTDKDGKLSKSYSILSNKGDQRINYYISEFKDEETEFEVVNKMNSGIGTVTDGTKTIYSLDYLTLYRRGLIYLRAAEALNCLAAQTHDADKALQAFGILRDGFDILFPEGSIYKEDLQPMCLGVHARGCGDVYLDTANYVVSDAAIAKFYGMEEGTPLTFNDTIHYVEDRIVNEIALETTFEGNRFTDLVRVAERRGPEYLAEKIATRKGSEKRDEVLYQKLLDKKNWYLPLK